MYKVLLDDSVLYYPGDDQCVITDAVLKLKVSQAGSFECIVPDINPLWNSISLRKSMITVYKDNTEIFCGEVREIKKDVHRRTCLFDGFHAAAVRIRRDEPDALPGRCACGA